MKLIIFSIIALFSLVSCVSLPTNAGIEIPVGDPVMGIASVRRIVEPNGTKLGFKMVNENIGNDQVVLEVNEKEVIITVYDQAFN